MKNIRSSFRLTLPVMAGYLVLGAGFGILMLSAGFTALQAILMSVFIYAGSMQYLGVELMSGGASLLSVAVTTLLVNARHLLYGISMAGSYRNAGIRKPYMIFALTDETYSIVCSGKLSHDECFAVSLLDHIYWVSGTVIGAVAGRMLPFSTEGIDFALTALFIVTFTGQCMSGKKLYPAVLGICASCLCLAVFGPDRFLIPAMLLIVIGILVKPEVKRA